VSFGVTSKGFIRKPLETILQDLRDKAKLPSFFGPDVDLSEVSLLSIWIQFFSEEMDTAWKHLESIFYNQFVDTATNVALDYVVGLGGITRNPSKKAEVLLRFLGVNGSPVPLGTICQTTNGIRFVTMDSGTVEAGSIDIPAQAILSGPDGIVPANSVTEIATPLTGIDSVSNPDPSFGGLPRETDIELRDRYKRRGVAGGSSLVALQTLLSDLPDTKSVVGYENVESFEDGQGRPPHSMEFVIEGGTNTTIADIFESYKPGGIRLVGDVVVTKLDPLGNPQTYRWNVPQALPIYVAVTIVKNSFWISGSESIVRENIIKVIGGIHTVGSDAKEYLGKGIGKPIYSWELTGAQFGSDDFDTVRIQGITSITIKVGLSESPTPNLDTLILTAKQKPVCLTSYITVGVT